MTPLENALSFRKKFAAGDTLIGSFIKTPSCHTAEILGHVGYDFLVIDAEHAPFDRGTIDAALLGARAGGAVGLVRVAEPTAACILAALDDGAAGVLVPHVTSRAKAMDVASACRYKNGKRGFSNSPRAGNYGGLGLSDHIAAQDAAVTMIAMIEDPEGVDNIESIATVKGIDGVFVGRGDLTVAMGEASITAAAIGDATEKVISAARRAGKPVCVLASSAKEAAAFKALGASAFLISSDQALMRQAASNVLAELRSLGVI